MFNNIELLQQRINELVQKSDSLQKETAQLEEVAIEIEPEQLSKIPRIDLLNHSLLLGKLERSRQRWKLASLILASALLLSWSGILLVVVQSGR